MMSKNRYFPFGYFMENGEIKLHSKESVIVKHIFDSTINGKSLNSLADYCNTQNTPYNENKPTWTKHMIRRILENKKYYEDDNYPQIISKDIFDTAYNERSRKTEKQDDEIKQLRKYIYCANCGEQMSLNKQKNNIYKCKCKNCMHESVALTIEQLQDEINHKLSLLFKNESIIKPPISNASAFPSEVIAAEKEINNMLEFAVIDSDEILTAIFNKAKAQYNICTAAELDPLTLYIKEQIKNSNNDDKQFFCKIVKKVLIGRNNIALKLINNQIIF